MGTRPSPQAYEETCVLLLGWTEECDDTGTASELHALQQVLQDSYRFSVRLKRLHLQTHPQIQATKHVVDFVYDEDRPGRPLIIYYAGHGSAGDNGRLMLAGSLTQDGGAAGEKSIDWTDIEAATLAKTRADVLVILDCCRAGLLCQPLFQGRSTRTFLYVAACKADQRTRSAGPQSFTSAMIWALKKLADEPGFTVRRLVRTLMSYEHFPRATQEPVVFDNRFGPGDTDIWLAPPPEKADADGCSRAEEDTVDDRRPTVDVLDLRFHFADRATEAVVEDTARAMKTFMRTESDLRFHRVSFLRHKSYVEGPARHWLGLVRKRKTAVGDDVGSGASTVP